MFEVYLFCAVVGCGFLTVQMALEFIGIGDGGDTDLDGVVDMEIDTDVESGRSNRLDLLEETNVPGPNSTWFFQVLTLRSLVAGVGFFGLGGGMADAAGLSLMGEVVIAALCGAAAMLLVAYIADLMIRLREDGSVRMSSAIGATGQVSIPVPANKSGIGKISVVVQNRTMEYSAMTEGDALPTGASITVAEIMAANTVLVKPMNG